MCSCATGFELVDATARHARIGVKNSGEASTRHKYLAYNARGPTSTLSSLSRSSPGYVNEMQAHRTGGCRLSGRLAAVGTRLISAAAIHIKVRKLGCFFSLSERYATLRDVGRSTVEDSASDLCVLFSQEYGQGISRLGSVVINILYIAACRHLPVTYTSYFIYRSVYPLCCFCSSN